MTNGLCLSHEEVSALEDLIEQLLSYYERCQAVHVLPGLSAESEAYLRADGSVYEGFSERERARLDLEQTVKGYREKLQDLFEG